MCVNFIGHSRPVQTAILFVFLIEAEVRELRPFEDLGGDLSCLNSPGCIFWNLQL